MPSQVLPPLNLPTSGTGTPGTQSTNVAIHGDVTGTTLVSSVDKLAGNKLKKITYGPLQDGYVLTWVNSDGYVEMKPLPTDVDVGGGGGSNIFFFRPSDPSPGGNVFLTFQEAYDAAIATKVPATIVCDDHIAQCNILAGTYDLGQITLKGSYLANTEVVVFIHDQVIFTGLCKIVDNIALLYDGISNPLISLDNQPQEIYLENGAFFTTINTSPFYSMINDSFVVIHLGTNCGIQPSGLHPVIIMDQCESEVHFDGPGSYLSNDSIAALIPGNQSFVGLIIEDAGAGGVPPSFTDTDIQAGLDTSAQALFINPLVGNTSNRPVDPFVREGMMYYDEQIGYPVWWDGSQWKEASKPYLPEYVMITIDSPQTTGLVTGGHVNFNTPLAATSNTNYGGYSSPGILFVNFNDSTQGPNYTNVAHKLVGNLGDFDGTIIYQWWDNTNNVGLGNVAGNAGNAKCSDAVALIPSDYMHNQSVAIFIELRLLFVGGTTAIGENSAGGFMLPWATLESIGTPVLT